MNQRGFLPALLAYFYPEGEEHMNPQTLEQAVAAHPFLMAINEHHIRLLADTASRTTFETGQLIFREGETANRFYLVESGKVA